MKLGGQGVAAVVALSPLWPPLVDIQGLEVLSLLAGQVEEAVIGLQISQKHK